MMELDGQRLSLAEVSAIARAEESLSLSSGARARAEKSRAVVEQIIAENRAVYGINTGFGKLSDIRIDRSDLQALQVNLVRSHSCGLGNPLSIDETRAMLLLRANVLALGYSGCRPVLIEKLIDMLNRGVTPVIPEKGSVGASGDLAPLAHLALTVIGEGEAFYEGERMPSAQALERANIEPLQLEAKEGIALLNGTQAMAAVGGLALHRAERVAQLADVAGAMTLEALKGTPVAFDERIHVARPQSFQIEVAAHLRELLRDSEIRQSHLQNDPRVQDAYCLRCIPQVHGAVRTALGHARDIVEIETGSATDNPLVFTDSGEVLSGGNFHGAPLALAFDYAAMGVTDLMSITERRIDRLVNPDENEDLPPFLTSHPGAASGFMMLQIVAVSLLNEAKVFAHPASIDNVPTDGGKEDHVSMGMTAATKFRSIVDLAEKTVAIELIAAAEGLEYRAPLKPGRGVRQAYAIVRKYVARLTADRAMSKEVEAVASAVRNGDFDSL